FSRVPFLPATTPCNQAHVPRKRLRRLYLSQGVQIRRHLEPLVHGRRRKNTQRDGHRARAWRCHDTARPEAGDGMAREDPSARRKCTRWRREEVRSRPFTALVSIALLAIPGLAGADVDEAQNEINAVSHEVGNVNSAILKAQALQLTVEQRLAGGEM